ncbi:MAG: hypothetical protein KKG59_01155, partial [Nanoarchaeota archaeon]|nr:hypothetical protein [Nanoarchaeota archaeon]
MIWYLLVLISALFLSGQDLLKKKLLIKEHTNLFTTIRVCVIAALGFVLIPFLDFSISLEILFLMYVVS